jgi:hypothetical protein
MGQSELLQTDADALLNKHLSQSYKPVLIAPIYESRLSIIRRWFYVKRLWWRFKYVYGAPYPPYMNVRRRQKFSWRKDICAAFKNPPKRRKQHR